MLADSGSLQLVDFLESFLVLSVHVVRQTILGPAFCSYFFNQSKEQNVLRHAKRLL